MRNAKTPTSLALANLAIFLFLLFLGLKPDRAAADESQTKPFAERLKEVEQVNNPYITELVKIYKDIHSHPELSLQEARTSAKLVGLMREFGYEVHPNVGGHGIVCILRNGTGPRSWFAPIWMRCR